MKTNTYIPEFRSSPITEETATSTMTHNPWKTSMAQHVCVCVFATPNSHRSFLFKSLFLFSTSFLSYPRRGHTKRRSFSPWITTPLLRVGQPIKTHFSRNNYQLRDSSIIPFHSMFYCLRSFWVSVPALLLLRYQSNFLCHWHFF